MTCNHNYNPISFEDYVNIDENVVVISAFANDKIIRIFKNSNETRDDEDLSSDDFIEEPFSVHDAKNSVSKICNFLEKCENSDEKIFSALITIDNLIHVQIQKNLKQNKITDFLPKYE